MVCLSSISCPLAAFAFKVHLADAPGEAEADITRVVAVAVVIAVVGVDGDGVGVGRLEEVGDTEVEREVAVEEVGAETAVDVEVGLRVAEELYLSAIELAIDKHVHLAPQLGIYIEAYIIAKDLVLHPFAGAYLHAMPAFSAPCVKAYVHKFARSPCEV